MGTLTSNTPLILALVAVATVIVNLAGLFLQSRRDSSDAVNKAIEDRDRREHLANGQGKILFYVRVILFFIGTAILLFSKWFALKSEE